MFPTRAIALLLAAPLPVLALVTSAPVRSAGGPSSGAAQDPHLKESDLKKLGEALRDYIDDERSAEAESEVKEAMDKLARKLEKTAAAGNVLASPPDLGLAYWLSYEYGRKRPKKGKIADGEYELEGAGFTRDDPLRYSVWAPDDYSAKNGPYPVILSLPDSAAKGKGDAWTPDQHITENWMDNDLRNGVILATPEMPEDAGTWSAVAIARVLVLMRAISEEYAVDFDKIFLCGHGAGVETAAYIADSFPDRFAGVIGMAGDLGDVKPDNFRNLATYFAGGGGRVTAFQEAAEALGYSNCTVEPAGTEKDVWNWVQATSRAAYPEEIVLVPGSPYPRRSAWLEVPPSEYDGDARISARVDRATNTFTVEGKGVTDFVLHLNDVLVDLNKPITVIANGQESRAQITRNYKAFLNNVYFGRCDPGRVFVASQDAHLPTVTEEEGGDEGN